MKANKITRIILIVALVVSMGLSIFACEDVSKKTANEFIVAVELLPDISEVTVEDETAVNAAKLLFDNLTDKAKEVEGVEDANTKLNSLVQKIISIKLSDAKIAKIAEITTLYDAVILANYREVEQAIIIAMKDYAIALINACTVITEVEAFVATELFDLSAIKTDESLTADELAVAKTAKIAEVTALFDAVVMADYRVNEQSQITTKKINAIIIINTCTVITEVNALLSTTLFDISEIKTDAMLTAEELAVAKTAKIAEVNALYGAVVMQDYRLEQQAEITAMKDNAVIAINACTVIAEVEAFVATELFDMSAIKTDESLTAEELAEAKTAKIAEVTALFDAVVLSDYRTAEKALITTIKDNAIIAINACTVIAEVEALVATELFDISKIKTDAMLTAEELANAKTAKIAEVNALYGAVVMQDYRLEQQAEITAMKDNAIIAINACTVIAEVEALVATELFEISEIKTNETLTAEELATAKIAKIAEVTALFDAVVLSDYRTAEKAQITTIKDNAIITINACTVIAEVEALVATELFDISKIKTDAMLTAEELAVAKTAKIAEVNALYGAVVMQDYRLEQQAEITAMKDNAVIAINACTVIAEVEALVATELFDISEIKTNETLTAEELAEAKLVKIAEVNALYGAVVMQEYRLEQQSQITTMRINAIIVINACTVISEVNQLVSSTLFDMSGVKTDAMLTAEELANAKLAKIDEVITLYNGVTLANYRTAEKAQIASIKDNAVIAINACTVIAEVNALVASTLFDISAVKTDAMHTAEEQVAKLAKIDEVITLYNGVTMANYRANEQAQIIAIKDNAVAIINACASLGEINALVASTLFDISAVKTDAMYAIEEKDAFIALYAHILPKSGNLEISDLAIFEEAIAVYEALPASTKALLTSEKDLLDSQLESILWFILEKTVGEYIAQLKALRSDLYEENIYTTENQKAIEKIYSTAITDLNVAMTMDRANAVFTKAIADMSAVEMIPRLKTYSQLDMNSTNSFVGLLGRTNMQTAFMYNSNVDYLLVDIYESSWDYYDLSYSEFSKVKTVRLYWTWNIGVPHDNTAQGTGVLRITTEDGLTAIVASAYNGPANNVWFDFENMLKNGNCLGSNYMPMSYYAVSCLYVATAESGYLDGKVSEMSVAWRKQQPAELIMLNDWAEGVNNLNITSYASYPQLQSITSQYEKFTDAQKRYLDDNLNGQVVLNLLAQKTSAWKAFETSVVNEFLADVFTQAELEAIDYSTTDEQYGEYSMRINALNLAYNRFEQTTKDSYSGQLNNALNMIADVKAKLALVFPDERIAFIDFKVAVNAITPIDASIDTKNRIKTAEDAFIIVLSYNADIINESSPNFNQEVKMLYDLLNDYKVQYADAVEMAKPAIQNFQALGGTTLFNLGTNWQAVLNTPVNGITLQTDIKSRTGLYNDDAVRNGIQFKYYFYNASTNEQLEGNVFTKAQWTSAWIAPYGEVYDVLYPYIVANGGVFTFYARLQVVIDLSHANGVAISKIMRDSEIGGKTGNITVTDSITLLPVNNTWNIEGDNGNVNYFRNGTFNLNDPNHIIALRVYVYRGGEEKGFIEVTRDSQYRFKANGEGSTLVSTGNDYISGANVKKLIAAIEGVAEADIVGLAYTFKVQLIANPQSKMFKSDSVLVDTSIGWTVI